MISPDNYPEIVISTNTTWNEENYIHSNVRIVDGVKLTITANTKMYFTSCITIESGGELIIDNGSITRGNIIVKNDGKMSIFNNGKVRLSNADNLKVELGGIFSQTFGKVEIID